MIEVIMLFTPKNVRHMFLMVFLTRLYVLMIESASCSLEKKKNAVNKFIEKILKENKYCKKMMKKHINKNLVMSVEDERSFKSSNKCN